MIITSKFAGFCGTCNGRIAVGQSINWERGQKSTHAVAADCVKTVAAPVTANAAPIATFLRNAYERAKVRAAERAAKSGKAPVTVKQPNVRFLGPNNAELRLTLAKETSKNPGAVFAYLSDEYLGSIATDGTVRGTLARRTDVLTILTIVAAAPAVAAKAYGALTCRCSFCDLGLTDEGSVEVGYGPICADNYGLPHTPKGTPTLRTVRPVAFTAPVAAAVMTAPVVSTFDTEMPF